MRSAIRKAIAGLAVCLLTSAVAGGARLSQQPQVTPVQRLVVQDSKGKIVGFAFGGIGVDIPIHGGTDLEVRTIVLLQVDRQVVPVAVGRDRFYGGRVLWFESENCVGTPWFSPEVRSFESPSLLPQAAIAPPGQTLYIATPGAPSQPITIRSLLEFGATCRNQTSENISALPSKALVDLSTVFTPPFSLRAAP